MPLSFPCLCGQPLQVRDDQAGSRVRCPACGREVEVPAAATAAPPGDETVTLAPGAVGDDRGELRERVRPADERAGAPVRKRSRVRDEEDDDEEEDDFDDRPRRPERTSGKAIAALVLGLLSPCASVFTGIPAIICGILGLRDIGRSRGRLGGSGVAITGIVLGVVGMLMLGPLLLAGLLLPAVQKVREAAARTASANNLRQMAIAMHNYNDTHGKLPSRAAITDRDGKPLLSWRVEMLPYLGHAGLYQQFKKDEPWDSPTNRALISLMPKLFAHPGADPAVAAQGMTHYRAVTGPRSAFEPRNGRPPGIPGSIPDGTSNTIMIAVAAEPVVWTKPDELEYTPGGPPPRLGLNPRLPFQVALWDGSVRQIDPRISATTLGNALMADDGLVLGPDW